MKRLDEKAPRSLAWLIMGGTGLLLSVMALGALALANGAGDPPRASRTVLYDPTRDALVSGIIALDPNEQLWEVGLSLPADAFSLEASARLTSDSDPSTAWGVWFEDAEGQRVVIAISAEGSSGYVTARRCTAPELPLEDCEALIEPNQHIKTHWKQSPFLKPVGSTNLIRLDYLPERWGGGVSLRLNHEWMWDIPLTWGDEWGLWVRGGRNRESTLEWQSLKLWPD